MRRAEEGIDIIRRAWSGERFSFTGKHYQVTDARLTPRPVQTPHPPLWLGAATPAARRRAAEKGHLLLVSRLPTLAETKAEFGEYTQALREYGHDPARFPRALIREFYVAQDTRQAWAEVQPHLLYLYRKVFCPPWTTFSIENPDGARQQVTDANDPFYESEAFHTDRFIIGDPELCARELRHFTLLQPLQSGKAPHSLVCYSPRRGASPPLAQLEMRSSAPFQENTHDRSPPGCSARSGTRGA